MVNSSESESAVSCHKKVVLGQLGKVHGIKGWLKLTSFTNPPENILDYLTLQAEIDNRWQILEIDGFRQQPNGFIVHIKGYDDPETSRQLTGIRLAVNNDLLPVLDKGSYYWHELVGMKVVNQTGQEFGRVNSLLETGANDVLVVTPTTESIDARERLIPYVADIVIDHIDSKARLIRVNWEADYLE
tara:strand:+ start:93 stop:653 length:561 start_codon:yes stop_codon:yes gene_type:complete